MNVEQTIVANVTVFRMSGAGMPRDAGTLHASVERALHRGARDVVLNLGGVTNVSAADLGALVKIYSAVRAFNGQLRLCAVPGRMRYLLAATGLAPFFDMSDSEPHAVAAVTARISGQETSVAASLEEGPRASPEEYAVSS